MDILNGTKRCSCGKCHDGLLKDCLIGSGVVFRVAGLVKKYGGKRAFLLADANTFAVAGMQVSSALQDAAIPYSRYIFPHSPKPNEEAVGSAVMHFDTSCDIVIGIGSGVINDIGKILANMTKSPYIIVATAPSMDGYASATSSMEVDGLKVSLPSKCADGVIGDTDILKNAPRRMQISGLGDMLAKYVSICEWRISHLITGEYYCEEVASLIRNAVKKCTEHAAGLLQGDEKAVAAVFEGLILGGVAMNYAGLSRPASGVEHYFSHIWDMRGLEFGTKVDFHGIQCAVGTLYATKVYEQLKFLRPDRDKALAFVQNFDLQNHFYYLRAFLGKGAEAMIAAEEKDGKYDPIRHPERLEIILSHWEEILQIMDEELLPSAELEALLTMLDAPKSAGEMGINEAIVPMTFRSTKDIRDKYVLSRLCWDLGVLEDIKL
ncbi:MAG: sn-glycerol-1-phosphate dehydrogenase [Ruminococcaceae bacterium]|nr:sn-glycerol-1-phosphate dehydrogenase [Oscillospiraceae bacterium]